MTLNLTLLTPTAIHQSADYQLFDVNRGRVLRVPSTKQVSVGYLDWRGAVTYAGIGRVGPRDTSSFVGEWLQSMHDATFADVAECIRKHGSIWLRSIRVDPLMRRHTFVLTAFVQGVATAAVISNHLRWQGQETSLVADELSTWLVRARSRPRLIVTGMAGSVRREQRRLLLKLAAADGSNGVLLRRTLAHVNGAAAGRVPQYISSDCFLFSQDRFGRSSEEARGETPARPTMLMNGMDMMKLVKPFLEQHFGPGGYRLVQSAGVTGGTPSVAARPCRPVRVAGAGPFDLVELANAPGGRATPRAVNASGLVVGEGAGTFGGPSAPCVWPDFETVQPLEILGGTGGSANAVDDRGFIAGIVNLPDGASHAATWEQPDGALVDLGTGPGFLSGARAIGPAGDVAGWIGMHPTERGQDHFRPALWSAGSAHVFELGGRWGEATTITSRGELFGFAHDGRSAALWVSRHGTSEIRPSGGCASYWLVGATDDGTAYGMCIGADGRRTARTIRGSGVPVDLGVPPGAELTAVGAGGCIAGRLTVDGVHLPWVKCEGDAAIQILPTLADHHHEVRAIYGDRLLVGAATADNCSHPLVWGRGGWGRARDPLRVRGARGRHAGRALRP